MNIDPLEVADELAEIASTTTDAATGEKLVKLIERLLAANGLPPDSQTGGGMPPSRLLSEPVCEPA